MGPPWSRRDQYGQAAYQEFIRRENAGEIPSQRGAVASPPATDVLANNNIGAGTTANFTQSETSLLAFGSTVVIRGTALLRQD